MSHTTAEGTTCQVETRAKVAIIKATHPRSPVLIPQEEPVWTHWHKAVLVLLTHRTDVRGGGTYVQQALTQTLLRTLPRLSPGALDSHHSHTGLFWLQENNRSRPRREELVEPVLELLLPSG